MIKVKKFSDGLYTPCDDCENIANNRVKIAKVKVELCDSCLEELVGKIENRETISYDFPEDWR